MTVTTKEGMTARPRRLISRISRFAARYPTPSRSHSAYASGVVKTEYQVAAQRIAGSSWCLEGLFPSDVGKPETTADDLSAVSQVFALSTCALFGKTAHSWHTNHEVNTLR